MKPSTKKIITQLPAASIITPEIIYRLHSFFESIPPHEFRDTLLELYHSYIRHEHEALPYNFPELAESLDIFLDFLKDVDGEFGGRVGGK